MWIVKCCIFSAQNNSVNQYDYRKPGAFWAPMQSSIKKLSMMYQIPTE